MATITRAMPCLSSLKADESITAMFPGAAMAGRVCGALGWVLDDVVGLVCVWARIAKVASAIMATVIRKAFMALLLDCVAGCRSPIAARIVRPCQSLTCKQAL